MPYKIGTPKEHIRKIKREQMKEYRANNPEYKERERKRMQFKRDNVPGYVEKEKEEKRAYYKEKLSDPIEKKRIYEINYQYRLARKKYCEDNKICNQKNMTCQEKALPNHKMCEKHFFQECAIRHLKDSKRGLELQELFYKQNQECYLSNKKLIIGVNASLDHIIPLSKGGTNDTSNLAWMDENSNYAKNNMSNEEFIELCRQIVRKHRMEKSEQLP